MIYKYNYHTHTTRCGHATGSEREYVEEAIKAGIKILGFSDHAPMPFEDGYVSRVRMLPEHAEEYVKTISALRDEYKNDIEIHIGFEAEYDQPIFDKLIKLCKDIGIEYLLLGQHFIGSEQERVFVSRISDDPEKVKKYTDQVIAAIETGKFTYVAHPDMLNYPYDDEVFRGQMVRLCKRAKELSVPLEYNLLGVGENRHYPTEKFFKIAKEVGNDIVIGRDVHYVSAMSDTETEKKAIEQLSKLGITPLPSVKLRPL